MEEKKYIAKRWVEIPPEDQGRLSGMLSPLLLKGKKDQRMVVCNICQLTLYKSISYDYWHATLTAKEQRHLDSERHQAGVLLQKLAGD